MCKDNSSCKHSDVFVKDLKLEKKVNACWTSYLSSLKLVAMAQPSTAHSLKHKNNIKTEEWQSVKYGVMLTAAKVDPAAALPLLRLLEPLL